VGRRLRGRELSRAAHRCEHPKFVERDLQTPDVALHYNEGPENGEPLVLLHGLARNCHDFSTLLPPLSQQWHVYAVDLRGHGKTSHVPGGYLSSGYALDVGLLLKQVVRRPAALFGHSLGGMTALRVAAEHPKLVHALILGDSCLSAGDFAHGLYPTLFRALLKLRRAGGSLEQIATDLAEIHIPLPGLDEEVKIGDLPGNDAAYLKKWAECLLQVDPQAIEMTLDASTWSDFDGEALMRRVECPTLILQANPDLGGLVSDEELKRATQLLAKPTVEKFPLLGHALHLQQPQPVLRVITRFLSGVAGQ